MSMARAAPVVASVVATIPTTTGAVIFIIIPCTDAPVGADGRARARRVVVVAFVAFVVVVAVALVRARIVVAIARVIAPSVDVSRQTRTRPSDRRAHRLARVVVVVVDSIGRYTVRSSGARASHRIASHSSTDGAIDLNHHGDR